MTTRSTPSDTDRKRPPPALAGAVLSVLSVLSVLVGACATAGDVPVATPPGELPALILPAGLVSDGTTPAAGGRPKVAANVTGTSLDGPGFTEGVDAGDPPRGDGELVSASPQPASYALIIGIEDYRDVPDAEGARADAERFAEVMQTTLGLPRDQVRILLDDRASRSDINKELRWLAKNVPAGGRIFFFYSGHGAPEPTKGVSYIVPYDGDPSYLDDTALKMSAVIDSLEKTQAKEVVAFADACFSGAGGRSV
ncbi:MAG: caspase family protein, partial [Myxococcales bacterium]|nr:caspase family protein [Myxococcales bacterium]